MTGATAPLERQKQGIAQVPDLTEKDLRLLALEAKFEDQNFDELTFKEFVKMMMNNE